MHGLIITHIRDVKFRDALIIVETSRKSCKHFWENELHFHSLKKKKREEEILSFLFSNLEDE